MTVVGGCYTAAAAEDVRERKGDEMKTQLSRTRAQLVGCPMSDTDSMTVVRE